jgi:hypothetical protein
MESTARVRQIPLIRRSNMISEGPGRSIELGRRAVRFIFRPELFLLKAAVRAELGLKGKSPEPIRSQEQLSIGRAPRGLSPEPSPVRIEWPEISLTVAYPGLGKQPAKIIEQLLPKNR